MRLPTRTVGEFPGTKFGDQRRMSGQNTDIPITARNLHLLCGVAYHESFGTDDFQLKAVCHCASPYLNASVVQLPGEIILKPRF